jgi:hypothetical protein
MIPARARVSCRGAGGVEYNGTKGLLLVGETDSSAIYTRTENIKHFEWRVASECTVQMLSGWIVVTRHATRNLAHAHLQHS